MGSNSNDMAADDELLTALKIGHTVVKRLSGIWPSLSDELESEMYVVIVEAMNTWVEGRGQTFTSWLYNVTYWRLRDFVRVWSRGVRHGRHLRLTSFDEMMEFKDGSEDSEEILPAKEVVIDIEDLSPEIHRTIETVLFGMDPRHATIIREWLNGTSLREAGAIFNLTESRASQVLKIFRGKLKERLALQEIYI